MEPGIIDQSSIDTTYKQDLSSGCLTCESGVAGGSLPFPYGSSRCSRHICCTHNDTGTYNGFLLSSPSEESISINLLMEQDGRNSFAIALGVKD